MIKKIPEACLLDLKINSNKILKEIENCEESLFCNNQVSRRSNFPKTKKLYGYKITKNGKYYNDDYLNEIPTLKKIIEQIPGKTYIILIADMEPKSNVFMHIDKGEYFENKFRFHIPLKTNDQVSFFVDKKIYNMKENEIWYIDNSFLHGVENNSEENRIHLIFDIEINEEIVNFVKSGNFNLGKINDKI